MSDNKPFPSAPDPALVEDLLAALKWAFPLARMAMETHRLERLKHGHNDIGAGRERNKTEQLIGLYDSEVESIDRAGLAIKNAESRTAAQEEIERLKAELSRDKS